jgi:ABC-2 type transport system permease protein
MQSFGNVLPGFWLVFWREFIWFRRRPFLLAVTTIVPLCLTGILMSVFSAGLATRLPIAVLDLDKSDLSRSIIRMVDATPDTAVAERISDLSEGRVMILSGRVYGVLLLQENLERDVFAGRGADVVFFYNLQKMTIGNLVVRGINAAIPAAAAGIKIQLRSSEGQPIDIAQAQVQPVPVQTNALFNPTLNYVYFLLAALIPNVLQIVIVTSSAYTVGLDASSPFRFRILRSLGGGLWSALAGKMLPYTIIFLMVLAIIDSVMFGVLGLPLRGNRVLLLASSVFFILSCQMIGAVLALFFPTARAVSFGSLLTVPAFGYMGVGFPRIGMSDFAYCWGSMLPGTWYLNARIDQTIRGTPFDLSLEPILILSCFVLALASLAAWRLKALRARGVGSDATTEPKSD